MDWIDEWKAAGENRDDAAAVSALSDEAVLVSPITDQFTFRGPEEIGLLLRGVFAVVGELQYTSDLRQGARAVLSATSTVDGVALDETQQLELDDVSGKICRLTFSIRPLPALTRLARRLGPELARQQGRRGAARTLLLAGGLLDTLAAAGDRRFVPLAGPSAMRE